jgi:hypothetical protein
MLMHLLVLAFGGFGSLGLAMIQTYDLYYEMSLDRENIVHMCFSWTYHAHKIKSHYFIFKKSHIFFQFSSTDE